MVISPDEGGMGRAVYFANVLGLDMGMFYKKRLQLRLLMDVILSLHMSSLELMLKARMSLSLMI